MKQFYAEGENFTLSECANFVLVEIMDGNKYGWFCISMFHPRIREAAKHAR